MTNDPRFDIDLQKKDLLDLASADGVAALFARLRYDTSKRTPHTSASLGISEAVARPIRRIELLADSDQFQVYMVELSSVTVAATRTLLRSFRDRAGDFLFVLTSDFLRLDFAFLDRLPDSDAATSITTATVAFRPRILTLDRRDPSSVAVRVLRRLTWTETDRFAQADKVRSAYSLAEWSEEEGLFNNRALFSDHYLKTRLPEEPTWRDDASGTFRSLRDLFFNRPKDAAGDEETLRRTLFDPAFGTLGFHAKQVRRDADEVSLPDYELYAAAGSETPIALCLTYPWARYLDGKDELRDRDTPNENPGAVVVSLLQRGDVPWVIVTNGKLWRLYAKRTHSRATSFYEVDLEEALAQAAVRDDNPFRYFWLLFRRQAFELVSIVRDGREDRVPFLDRLLLESEDYARELGDRLKERVFERVFPHLADGFVARWDGEPSDEDLQRTYRATLTVLYRVLFLLYAETRDLLPVREVRGYFSKSFAKLKKDIAEDAGKIEDDIEKNLKKTYDAGSTELYDRLSELFAIIDNGSSDLNVPFYNGGLFATSPAKDDTSEEAEAARFLRDHAIPDRQLAAAIDLLSREDDPRYGRIFVDYKSLGVRHLGSIYEGLLEFRLQFAPERLGIVREKGRDIYKPWRELDERKKAKLDRDGRFVKKGQLYLDNDKHERKATGSYYTPDHIVKYIVEHAVGPVVTEKLEALRPKLRGAQAWHRNAPARSRAKGETKVRNYDYGPIVEDEWRTLIDDVFDVKVLDPAMGSGHFLVEAVDFITDRILDFLNAFPWNPVTAHLRWTRETILKEMERQSISIDPGKLTDVNLLKRHVLKRCIYGVDLNPMAVELAKVSLWLDCFTLGAPLSFLDHHLRAGNSLVGVTLEEVEEKLKGGTQANLFSGNKFEGLKQSVAGMVRIGALSDVTAAQMKESREEYRRASNVLRPAKRLLDVYTSQWFGNDVVRARGRADVNAAIDFLGDKASEVWAQDPANARLGEDFARTAKVAEASSENSQFFHWQLEFPEVFFRKRHGTSGTFDRVTDGGFDAIVGNPPYIRVQELKSGDPAAASFIGWRDGEKRRYSSAVANFDVSLPFLELGLRLTNRDVAFIVPNKWFATDYGSGLRKVVRDRSALARVVDFRDHQLFEGATNYTAIVFLSKEPRKTYVFVDAHDGTIGEERNLDAASLRDDPGRAWVFSSDSELRLLNRLLEQFPPLREFRDRAFQGLRTSDNDVYVVESTGSVKKSLLRVRSTATGAEHEIEASILKPFVSGEQIRAFSIEHTNRWILFPYDLAQGAQLLGKRRMEREFPNAWAYLRECEDRLRARERGRMDVAQWWAYGRTQNLDQFEQPKIMLPGFDDEPAAGLDAAGTYYNASGYSITLQRDRGISLAGLTTLLNSDLLFWVLIRLGVALQRGFVEFRPQYLDRLPIARLQASAREDLERLAKLGAESGYMTARRAINDVVAHIYGLSPEDRKIVEASRSQPPMQ